MPKRKYKNSKGGGKANSGTARTNVGHTERGAGGMTAEGTLAGGNRIMKASDMRGDMMKVTHTNPYPNGLGSSNS